jgi:hypothetical protein
MNPNHLSMQLRRIASAIDNSRNPSRDLVAKDLKILISSILDVNIPDLEKNAQNLIDKGSVGDLYMLFRPFNKKVAPDYSKRPEITLELPNIPNILGLLRGLKAINDQFHSHIQINLIGDESLRKDYPNELSSGLKLITI